MIEKELIHQAAEDIDIFEADLTDEFERLRKSERKRIPLWPWFGAAAASIVLLLTFHYINKVEPETEQPVVAEVVEVAEPETPQTTAPTEVAEHPIVAQAEETNHKSIKKKKQDSEKVLAKHNKPDKPEKAKEAQVEPVLAESKPQQSNEARLSASTREQEENLIPPDKQALVDIFLAEEALQVAYELRAQQEAIRAYAASLTGEELPKPIIAL